MTRVRMVRHVTTGRTMSSATVQAASKATHVPQVSPLSHASVAYMLAPTKPVPQCLTPPLFVLITSNCFAHNFLPKM